MQNRRLVDFASDVTSQNGEDGMLAELLRRLGVDGGWCVELGAWDGKHLSNTWNLWHESQWSAVLIEGDTDRAQALCDSTSHLARVHVIHSYAQACTRRSLDALFARTPIPTRFDVLSLDVDGDDYHLWADLNGYRPLVVIVEYNVTFPPEIDFVQEPGAYIGSSARSLVRLAEEKGYELAGMTPANLLFIDREAQVNLDDLETDLDTLFDRSLIPVVYSDFSGHHFVLRVGGFGYTAASLHGRGMVSAQLLEAAVVASREIRRSAGRTKHSLAVRVPVLAALGKAARNMRNAAGSVFRPSAID